MSSLSYLSHYREQYTHFCETPWEYSVWRGILLLVDGGWTDYSVVTWSGKCSTTCDFGTESGVKTRTCTNPAPAFGGGDCVGESTATENRQCKAKECPSELFLRH